MNAFDIASNVAFFLLEKTGSVCGKWEGRMSAKDQRALFGKFLGKGMVHIDGSNETIRHTVKVCFGMDYDVTFDKTFAQMVRIARGTEEKQEQDTYYNPHSTGWKGHWAQ